MFINAKTNFYKGFVLSAVDVNISICWLITVVWSAINQFQKIIRHVKSIYWEYNIKEPGG